MTATKLPSIESCLTRAVAADHTEAFSNVGSSKCSEQNNFYGRFQVQHFVIDLNFEFVINIDSIFQYLRPKFVPSELFGITDADVRLEKVAVAGNMFLYILYIMF